MNEELQKALAELLNKANDGIDKAGGFLSSELPEVIQQMLTWYVIENFVWFVLNVIIAFIFVYGFNKFRELNKQEPNAMWEIPTFLSACSVLMTSLMSVGYLMESVKIYIAPKLWLIEYAAKLASQG